MAWIKDRWVQREERAEIIQTYREYIEWFHNNHDIDGEIDYDLIIEYGDVESELERLERIHLCEVDQMEFAIEYFSEARNPGNAGNWDGFDIENKEDSAEFHLEITDIMNNVSTNERNAQVAIAAPRSHSKSTYLTKNFPLHQVVYRKRDYIIIISETPSVSVPNLEWLATQLKHNEKLRNDFGGLLSVHRQENVRDNSQEFITWEKNGESKRQLTKVEAASTGQALRGRNWNGTRPDLIVCDDLEDAKTNAATEEQRIKLRDWFSSVVMPLGDPKGEKTAIVYMGTTVHFDSLLMHILNRRSDFMTRIYRAMVKPPERTDLWEECREIYQTYDNPNRQEEAEAFFKSNKKEMMKGAKVLWEEFQPLWKLMQWRWNNGSKAFNTEYQNNPLDEDSMIFNPELFTYWNHSNPTQEFRHSDYTIAMGVDVAMGKTDRGDYSAVITVAKHKETGVTYVIDAWGDKVHPDKFIEIITDKVIEFEPDVIGVEAVALQEYFADTLTTYLQNRGYPTKRRIKKIYHRSRKELRIEAMLPSIDTKKLLFNDGHILLLEQMERFGQGGHDDLPDALSMALSVSENVKRPIRKKPSWA